MLKPPDNLKQLCVYSEKLEIPIAIYPCSDWEVVQVSYLKSKIHTTESIVKWCIDHKISYQIIYSLNRISIIKNPRKAFEFIKMKRNLKQFNSITKSKCSKWK